MMIEVGPVGNSYGYRVDGHYSAHKYHNAASARWAAYQPQQHTDGLDKQGNLLVEPVGQAEQLHQNRVRAVLARLEIVRRGRPEEGQLMITPEQARSLRDENLATARQESGLHPGSDTMTPEELGDNAQDRLHYREL